MIKILHGREGCNDITGAVGASWIIVVVCRYGTIDIRLQAAENG